MKNLILILIALMSFVFMSINAQTSSLKVTSSGDVGIGTDTPDEKFEVVGNVKIEGRVIERIIRSKTNSLVRPFQNPHYFIWCGFFA